MGDLTEILLGCSDFGRLLENFLQPTASSGTRTAAVHRLWLLRSKAGFVDLVQQAQKLAQGS